MSYVFKGSNKKRLVKHVHDILIQLILTHFQNFCYFITFFAVNVLRLESGICQPQKYLHLYVKPYYK
jgi:hypothetical protein